MTLNRKRLLVDFIGYASLVPYFIFYNYLKQDFSAYVAVIIPVIAFLPIAALWHYFYYKFSENG